MHYALRHTLPILLLGLLVLTPSRGHAKDAPRPTREGQHAARIAAAHAAKDGAALEALAAEPKIDPWMVVELLCVAQETDAARAYATALEQHSIERTDIERLPAYIEARSKQPVPPELVSAWADASAAVRARKLKEVVQICAAVKHSIPTVIGVRLAGLHGPCLQRTGPRAAAIPVYVEAAARADAIGWIKRAASMHNSAAELLHMVGRVADAAEHAEQALAHFRTLMDQERIAGTLGNVGLLRSAQGKHREALEALNQGLALSRQLGKKDWVAHALGNLGKFHAQRGALGPARDYYEQALSAFEALKDPANAITQLSGIGHVYRRTGDLARALTYEKRAVDLAKRVGQPWGLAVALDQLGATSLRLGNLAGALEIQEQAIRAASQTGNQHLIARTLQRLGATLWSLGDADRASELFERALNTFRANGLKHDEGQVHIQLGLLTAEYGELDAARDHLLRAKALYESSENESGLARVHSVLASLNLREGNLAAALAHEDKALPLHKATGDRAGAVESRARRGTTLVRMGEASKGMRELRRAVRSARHLRDRHVATWCLHELAVVLLDQGEADQALALAHEGLREVEQLVGGLADERGAVARQEFRRVFDVGARAAIALDDPAEVVTFAESDRAGALLESLQGRQSLLWAQVPEALRIEDARARSARQVARAAFEDAMDKSDVTAQRAARHVLDDAVARVRESSARIQRAAKSSAVALFYPRALPLEDLQAGLGKDEQLLLFGGAGLDMYCVVVGRSSARTVSLGTRADIEEVCKALDPRHAWEDVSKPIVAARAKLIAPLKLPKSTKRVILSPAGPLSYLPFSLLMPFELSYTPSGTTLLELRSESTQPGHGVLALGVSDYSAHGKAAQGVYRRSAPLRPLPHTKAEVEAVGTVPLIGAKATEAGLRTALKTRPRWRAIHFACHGLVDPERPNLSSLALSPLGDDDGFLTGLEVVSLDMPTDMAVLSACVTGVGRIVEGEGILGLTRAFMFAGAPRVLCSLWEVDDKATSAFMKRFYELWHPPEGTAPLSAAAALRAAQEHVRDQEQWKHPYFWAAWVLWGLPE